jgi:xanthine dehydrogenase accessory factor
MSIAFYQHLANLLTQEPVVLATVVQAKGSVPREIGAKMMIWEPGNMSGTIGGGAGEAKVIRQGLNVLETGISQTVEIDLSGATDRETQGVCGGKMQVWLERWEGAAAIARVNQILAELKAGRSVELVTELLTETIAPDPLLLIVGAGHVGIQLAKVAHIAGFEIAVQDDRREWANPDHYPQATLIVANLEDAIAQLTNHTRLYVALVTRGYQQDLEALQSLSNQAIAYRYIGMIGSKKRVQRVFQEARAVGIAENFLRSLHAPIGLAISALTPEEIAISICAELILVRRGVGQIQTRSLPQPSKSSLPTSLNSDYGI